MEKETSDSARHNIISDEGWRVWPAFKAPLDPAYNPTIQNKQVKGAGSQCNT